MASESIGIIEKVVHQIRLADEARTNGDMEKWDAHMKWANFYAPILTSLIVIKDLEKPMVPEAKSALQDFLGSAAELLDKHNDGLPGADAAVECMFEAETARNEGDFEKWSSAMRRAGKHAAHLTALALVKDIGEPCPPEYRARMAMLIVDLIPQVSERDFAAAAWMLRELLPYVRGQRFVCEKVKRCAQKLIRSPA